MLEVVFRYFTQVKIHYHTLKNTIISPELEMLQKTDKQNELRVSKENV